LHSLLYLKPGHLEGLANYSAQKRFPKGAIGLGNALERLGQNLLAEGIDIEKDREGGTGKRRIKITNLNFYSSQSSHLSQTETKQQALSF
jgi:hypothetical protein